MSTSEYLAPQAEDPSQEKIWTETWKRLDRFLPDLRGQLGLESKEVVVDSHLPPAAPENTDIPPSYWGVTTYVCDVKSIAVGE